MMKLQNQPSRLKTLLVFYFLLLPFYFLLVSPALAADFTTDYDVTYEVLESTSTYVTQNVTLTNNTANLYPANYTLIAEGTKIENVKGRDSQGQLAIKVNSTQTSNLNTQTSIFLTFNKKAIGKGSKISWTLEYDTWDLAKKRGKILEVNLPGITESTEKPAENNKITSYNVTLKVPKTFGSESYISPEPSSTEHSESHFIYNYRLPITENRMPISAAFGDYQLFNFTLKYHLKNPLSSTAITEIALPPDFLPYQQTYIQKLVPKPKSVRVDEDGNFLALYQLKPKQKLTVIYKGQAKISAKCKVQSAKLKDDLKMKYLQPAKFWEVDDAAIQETLEAIKKQISYQPSPRAQAEGLPAFAPSSGRGVTSLRPELRPRGYQLLARAICDYVTTTLKYNPERITPEVQRLGAAQALKNKENAVCMEFTDLTITLMRAAGIPARELDGFAYSANDERRPTGSDALHSWAQIYLDDYGWLNIDPTWSATSKQDYFSKLDTNHLIFVIKGQDPEKPYPAGSYKTDESVGGDVEISFAETRAKNTIPFALWWQNWERENEKLDLLDLIFRFLARSL